MLILYKLTFKSGKAYIGQTVRKMPTRLGEHRRAAASGSGLAVHLAWAKYGDPDVCVLMHCQTKDELDQAESDAIIAHGTLTPLGYNIGLGGKFASSKSPAVAAKISAKAKGRLHSDAVKQAITETCKGNWKNPEYRQRVAEGVAASWNEDARAKRAEAMKELWAKRKAAGFAMKEATKAKLSAREITPEWREKMSLAAKGRKKAERSASTRQKLADTTREQWKDPEIRARRAAAIRAGHAARKERLKGAA
jgi:hypothetical protein